MGAIDAMALELNVIVSKGGGKRESDPAPVFIKSSFVAIGAQGLVGYSSGFQLYTLTFR